MKTLRLLPCLFLFAACTVQPPADPVPDATEDAPQEPAETARIPAPQIPALEVWDFPATDTMRHLHADARAPANGDGTEAAPFRTIQDALDEARVLTATGAGVTLHIHPGVYRETLELINPPESGPLFIEAQGAILSGSDVFADWQPVPGNPNILQQAWPHSFGWEKNPWPGLMPIESPGFRRELLFVNGVPQHQVLDFDQLTPGTYFVDEDQSMIFFHPENDTDARNLVEVSVRPATLRGAHSKMIRMVDSHNVRIRGLTIRHAASELFNDPAINVLGGGNLLFEDVTLSWNNGTGIAFMPFRGNEIQNLTLIRLLANDNGTMGIGGGAVNVKIIDSQTNRNNWRGARFGATGWAPCGFKFAGMNGLHLINHQTMDNHASGAWFDTDNVNILIDGLISVNNFRAGISIEAERGPFLVRNSVFMGNGVGVSGFDSTGIAIENNVIADNLNKQLRIAGSTDMPPEALAQIPQDWRRHRLGLRTLPHDWIILRNVIADTRSGADSILVSLEMPRERTLTDVDGRGIFEDVVDSLTAQGNRFHHQAGIEHASFTDTRLQFVPWDVWSARVPDTGTWTPEIPPEFQQTIERIGTQPNGFAGARLEAADELGQ